MYISKKKIWIALFVLLLALAFFAVRSDFFQYALIPMIYPKYGAENYVNLAIPSGFQFTSGEEIPEKFMLKLKTDSINIYIEDKVNKLSFYCKATGGEIAEIVDYYAYRAGRGFDGGSSRYAAVCGDEYVIYSYDARGPGIYGPFTLK